MMKMKLNLFFIVMDLLTLLVYPIVFVYSKLCQFVKAKERTTLVNSLFPVSDIPD